MGERTVRRQRSRLDAGASQSCGSRYVCAGLARLRTFCQLWSLKEAALKSIGEGLPFGLDAFEFELTPNLRVVSAPPDYGGPERFNAQIMQGLCAALVIRSVA